MIGSSRARMFEVDRNWIISESVLKKKITNLSDFGGGVLNQFNFLDFFYKQGNQTKIVLYFIDPFMLKTDKFDKVNMLNKEPLMLKFLSSSFKNNFDTKVLLKYIISKRSLPSGWLTLHKSEIYDKVITDIDTLEAKKRLNYLEYSTKESMFSIQSMKVKKIIDLVNHNNTELIFIIMPALIRQEHSYIQLVEFLKNRKEEFNIDFYDFSDVMRYPEFFFDYDHFNRQGVDFFLKNYLKPIIDNIQS